MILRIFDTNVPLNVYSAMEIETSASDVPQQREVTLPQVEERKFRISPSAILRAIIRVIIAPKRALDLRRASRLNKHILDLWDRYNSSGSPEDLNEMIRLCTKGLDLLPPGRPHRSAFLNNLASALKDRYNLRGSLEDFEHAMRLRTEALSFSSTRSSKS